MVAQGGFIPQAWNSICLIENKQIFKATEVCAMNCSARELTHKARSKGDYSFTSLWIYDRDGYAYCYYCKRISTFHQLIQCPVCSNYFKGPRVDFPIDYECSNCE